MLRIVTPPPRLLVLFIFISFSIAAHALENALELRDVYQQTVDKKLILPELEQRYYADLLAYTLQQGGVEKLAAQYMLLVDRSPRVQAIFLFWYAEQGDIEFVGASPASTGTEGGFEYFETPVGIFDHSIKNPDFRAEGTQNSHGLMGYGNKGLRVYDFGWVSARKFWLPEMGKMRLQLHSTDLLRLEPKLGFPQSKGCVRIPATLNTLIDHYGVLDADYEQAGINRSIAGVLDSARIQTPWSGRYLIIVDSRRMVRPDWSLIPEIPAKKKDSRLLKP